MAENVCRYFANSKSAFARLFYFFYNEVVMKKVKLFIVLIIFAAAIGVSSFIFPFGSKTIKIANRDTVSEPAADEVENSGDNTAEISQEVQTPDLKNDFSETNNAEENKKEKTEAIDKKENDSSFKITNKFVSWGYAKAEGRIIDTIVIHSSYNALGGDVYDSDKLIKEYKEYGVAPHYLIDRKGNAYKLVEEKNIAYHAGESKVPDGRTNVNNFSIGIELMNTKTDKFTDAQYSSLNKLLKNLKDKYKIKYVLGHNQIAPGRKDDPWNFDPLRITN